MVPPAKTFVAALAAAVGALLAPEPARADPACDAYVADVLAHQQTIHAAMLRRDALLSDASGVRIWPDPTLTVMADYLPGSLGTVGVQMPMMRYQLAQMVMWPGKLPAMSDALHSEADAAGAAADTKRLDLTLEARRAFFMLVSNGKRRELNRAARGLAAVITSAAIGRYGSQSGEHHEVARAELEVQALDLELASIEGERKSVLAMINALRNQPPDATFDDPRVVSWTGPRSFDVEALMTLAIAQRAELRQMTAMQAGMTNMARLARKEPYPDFMVGAWFNQMIMGGPHSFGFMLGTTLPTWGIERARFKAEAFDDRARAVADEATAMRAMIRAQVVDALTQFETASRLVTLLEASAMPKARESFDSSLSGYSAGTADIIAVLDARRSLQSTERMLIDARVQREVALALLERAVGGAPGGTVP